MISSILRGARKNGRWKQLNSGFEATQGPKSLAGLFYYDESPDKIYYQGLAWRISDENKAKNVLIN